MKKLLTAVCLVVGLTGIVFATIPSDSFQITFTPIGARGVIISSDTAPVALGNLAPGSSTVTGAIPTMSTGTIANIEYTITGAIGGGAALTAHNSGNTSPANSEVMVQAIFNTNSTITWDTWKDNVDTTARDVGNVTQDGSFIGDYASGNQMDSMALLASRNLFCKLVIPGSVSYTGVQTVTVTLTARQGD